VVSGRLNVGVQAPALLFVQLAQTEARLRQALARAHKRARRVEARAVAALPDAPQHAALGLLEQGAGVVLAGVVGAAVLQGAQAAQQLPVLGQPCSHELRAAGSPRRQHAPDGRGGS
jgi:hypothetical protein